VAFPDNLKVPATDNLSVGVVLPIPIFPFAPTNNAVVDELAPIAAAVEFITVFTVVFPRAILLDSIVTLEPKDIAVLFNVKSAVLISEGLTLTDAVAFNILICVAVTSEFTVALPTNNAVALAITLAPTATTVALTVEIPTRRSTGDKFAVLVEFDTCSKVAVCEALTVALPTNNVVALAITLAPTET
jgi:hypothetical protein